MKSKPRTAKGRTLLLLTASVLAVTLMLSLVAVESVTAEEEQQQEKKQKRSLKQLLVELLHHRDESSQLVDMIATYQLETAERDIRHHEMWAQIEDRYEANNAEYWEIMQAEGDNGCYNKPVPLEYDVSRGGEICDEIAERSAANIAENEEIQDWIDEQTSIIEDEYVAFLYDYKRTLSGMRNSGNDDTYGTTTTYDGRP